MQAKLKLVLVFLFASVIAFAQIPNNTWRDHFAYNQAHSVVVTPNSVFCAMYSGGMVSYAKESGEIEKMSKITGLSDINITALAYSEYSNVLIIGYNNGNVDLLTSNGIINIPDIKRKRMSALKSINEICVYNNRVFLACGFGVVELDVEKQEIRDTYYLGAEGASVFINDVSVVNNTVYAASDSVIYNADLDAPNLVDYSFWNSLNVLNTDTIKYQKIEGFNNELFAIYSDTKTSNTKLIRIGADNSWQHWQAVNDTNLQQISSYNNQLSVVGNRQSYFFNNNLQLTNTLDVVQGRQVVEDADGYFYAAANFKGFLRIDPNKEERTIYVNGPRFNTTTNVATKGDYVWVGSGGPSNMFYRGAAYQFNNEKWKSFSSGYTKGVEGVGNFYKFAFSPANDQHVYASSYSYGIFEFVNDEVVANHCLESVPAFASIIKPNVGVRAAGLDFDADGNLWTIMEASNQTIFVLRNGGSWEKMSGLSSKALNDPTMLWRDLLVTETNQVWMLTLKEGIVVVKENFDGTKSEKYFALENQDGNSLSQGYCMAEDLDGDIWVGTSKGPLVFSSNNKLFDDAFFHGNQIKLNRNDDSGLADFLLDYERINDIAVDGGNRKWLATENSGIFLVSEDGEETLHHFTEDNSPLPSNTVVSVGVHEKTGEVIISTSEGIVGFMGRATLGNEDFNDVHVYPNPIRPEYNGDITITGLIEDASVKITDISGNVVYDTQSLGGQAIWNGYNYNGDRVRTGVYLVFLTNSDGTKTQVAKMVFIR